jgi:hypothetical protein
VEAIVDYAGIESHKWMAPRQAKVETVVLDDPERLVEALGLDKGISANHGCPGASNWVAFKKHEEIILPRPADMGRPYLMTIFIDDPLCTEAKDSFRVLGESLDMSLECSRAQTIVRVEKD